MKLLHRPFMKSWAAKLGAFFSVLGICLAIVWWRMGTVNPASPPAEGDWAELIRDRIKVPEGWRFSVHATGLGSPRSLQMTEGGDLLVSSYDGGTIHLLKTSGERVILAKGLSTPHGLLLEGGALFVAEEHRVLKYDFDGAALSNQRVILEGIPEGGHSSRTIKRGPDGFLYLSVGSSCNSCIEDHPWRAAIIRFKEGGAPEIFAQGLRNTVGFDWKDGVMYGVDHGRDNLGDDVPDDEVNRIEQGRHYGWPYLHGADVHDPKLFSSLPPGLGPVPQFHGLGGHVAPLSIKFLRNEPNVALIAEHGSWNRSVKSGYRIIRLTIEGESAREEVFLSGCERNEEVICRPVDVLEAPDGSLFVSDDYAGAVYRIAKAP